MNELVQVTINDGVMLLTLNRPEINNAINKTMAKGIAAAMDELDGNNTIHAAIITGAGDTFCAGMDLKAFANGEVPYIKGRGIAGIIESPPKKPLIAAIEGYALGGGFEIALVCDLIVAADNARFGIPEVKRGLIAGAGGLLRLPVQIAPRIAMELALTGEPITAARAYELGLINRVTRPGNSLEIATQLAEAIVANAPLAVQASKRIIVESRHWPGDEMFARQFEIMLPVARSRDASEGAKAFAEKRAPVWQQR